MVRYVNVTKGYGVRYWSVGNEANLWANYTAARYVAEWRVYAEAMLEGNPDIIFVGPDTSQFSGVEGDMVDIVSLHRYAFGTNAATLEGLRADAAGVVASISLLDGTFLQTLEPRSVRLIVIPTRSP